MKTIYQCKVEGCSNTFQVEQGSTRRFCPECMAKRVSQGIGGKKGRPRKVTSNT